MIKDLINNANNKQAIDEPLTNIKLNDMADIIYDLCKITHTTD